MSGGPGGDATRDPSDDFVSDIAFTPAVKAEQDRRGSRAGYRKMAERRDWPNTVTDDLAAFVAERDSFYLATSHAAGQPYIQHRGGPPGFLRVVDERTLGIADFAGNRQYITLGNLAENDKAFLFLMDYARQRRVKIWARARVVEDDPDLLARLVVPGYDATPERALLFRIEAWDVNCPQHITRRYTEAQIAPAVAQLQARIGALEAELAALRGGSAGSS
jgi:predicted pyridoxine 5'-phosphate oxidase superfamily flavin-nucleotide-binding protein